MVSASESEFGLQAGAAGEAPKSRRMPMERLLAFVSPALPIGAVGLPLTIYLPVHYSGYIGLPLAAVGFAFFLVRTMDIAFDPLMGWVVDRTRTPWGQCRPWMIVGAAIIVAATLMLFMARPGVTMTYLIVGLSALYVGTSIVAVAQPAWAARLAPGYSERSHLYAWMQVAGSAGTFLLLGLPMLGASFGGSKPGDEIHTMGIALAITLPIAMVLLLWRVPEPPVPRAHEGSDGKVRLRDYILLMKRPAIVRLVIADLFISLGTATSSTLFLFFWRSARGYTDAETNFVIIMYFLAALVAVPLWVRLVRHIGKHKAFILSGMGYVLVMPAMVFVPRDRMDIVVPAMCLVGLTFAAGNFLIRSMAADAGDEARLDTGVDRIGQIYALLGSTSKVGSAVAVGIAFGVLDVFGFNAAAGAGNTPEALRALELIYVGAPAVLTFLGLLAFIGYRLDKDSHARIQLQLAERDAAAAAAG